MTLRTLLFTPIPLFPRRVPRQTAAQAIAAANLPTPIPALLTQITRRTRLKKHEQLAVATDLISHFSDALAAGVSPSSAISAFGDPVTAAKLIRRAKIRARPLPWHLLRALRWSAATLALFYLASAAYFLSGKPTISINYIDRFNAALPPEQDRAWPLYRQALLALKDPIKALPPIPTVDDGPTPFPIEALPGQPGWDNLVAFLNANQSALDLARRAAAKPAYGFILGPNGSASDPELFTAHPPRPADDATMLMNVLLPDLNGLRELSQVLLADTRLAASTHDSARFVSNIQTLIGMSRHLSAKPSMLVTNLVGLSFRSDAIDAIESALVSNPDFLSPSDLQTLSHLLGSPRVASDLIDLTFERSAFADILQRTYTDDGQGDGRLTPAGIQLLNSLVSYPPQIPGTLDRTTTLATSGTVPLTAATRKQSHQLYNQILDLTESNFSKPLRDTDWTPVTKLDAQANSTVLGSFRHPPVAILRPSLSRLQLSAERLIARTHALQIALAAEHYRRTHGHYPAALSDLVPSLLPTLPPDPATGNPLRYTLRDGKPLIYSLGADRDDDGGNPGELPPKRITRYYVWPNNAPSNWDPRNTSPADGDWILFPPPPSQF